MGVHARRRLRGLGKETAKAVDHEVHDVALATIEVIGLVERDADRRCDGAGVHQRKPTERDDTEKELGGVARGLVVEAELVADRGERLLAGDMRSATVEQSVTAQRLALDESDEVGPSGEEVEVVRHGTGENGVTASAARQGASPSCSNGITDFREAPVEHGLVEIGL